MKMIALILLGYLSGSVMYADLIPRCFCRVDITRLSQDENPGKMCIRDSYLTDELLGVTFHISANSFYQVNSKGAEKIYQTALAYAQLTADDVVWDLYCGIGTMTLLAAKRARRAIGIENIPAAVALSLIHI